MLTQSIREVLLYKYNHNKLVELVSFFVVYRGVNKMENLCKQIFLFVLFLTVPLWYLS